ncbi:MAG: 1-acyl-sn-glycerol-3-phosphate acyltransferase [Deltaproteobacteria bacterium]|nr:1-acyl-sn-glycerol-3-phosphate acyltransferase [Deltaproteobacteria bacterium]
MSKILLYLRVGLTGAWFFFGTFLSICVLIVRWKDPSVGAILGRIVSLGGSWFMGFRVRIENQKALYLHQPCVYVGNHQSNMDIITMGQLYPYRTVVIGKKELKWMPLFGLFFIGTGMIMIDRQNRRNSVAGLEVARKAMVEDRKSIWIFVEGTRNRGRVALLPFKKGAFHLAIAGQVPIVPFVHQYLPTYFDVPQGVVCRDGREVLIRVLDPIPTVGMTADDIPRLMAQVRAAMIQAIKSPDLKFPPALVAALEGPAAVAVNRLVGGSNPSS